MADHPTKSDGSPDPEADIVAGDGTDHGRKNYVRDAELASGARVHGGCDEYRLPWNRNTHALDCDGTAHDPRAISTDGVGQSRIKRHEGSPLCRIHTACRREPPLIGGGSSRNSCGFTQLPRRAYLDRGDLPR